MNEFEDKDEEIENNWFKFQKPKFKVNWSKEQQDKHDDDYSDMKEQFWGMHMVDLPCRYDSDNPLKVK